MKKFRLFHVILQVFVEVLDFSPFYISQWKNDTDSGKSDKFGKQLPLIVISAKVTIDKHITGNRKINESIDSKADVPNVLL